VDASGNHITKDYEITAKQSNCAEEPAVTQFAEASSLWLERIGVQRRYYNPN
jgi:hypothetical protein